MRDSLPAARLIERDRRDAIVAHLVATGCPALPGMPPGIDPRAAANAALDRMTLPQIIGLETEMRWRSRAAPNHSYDYDPCAR
jgi:hypothetical protein